MLYLDDVTNEYCKKRELVISDWYFGERMKTNDTQVYYYSASRKVDTKVANLLLKLAQKVATLKSWFKTSLKWVLTS